MPLISPRSASRRAMKVRDAGLRKISLTTKALVVGSIAATGLFSALAAAAQPGRSKSVSTAAPALVPGSASGSGFRNGATRGSVRSTPTTATPTAGASTGNDASQGDDNLAPPATAPAPAYEYTPPPVQYSPPVVVSGAS